MGLCHCERRPDSMSLTMALVAAYASGDQAAIDQVRQDLAPVSTVDLLQSLYRFGQLLDSDAGCHCWHSVPPTGREVQLEPVASADRPANRALSPDRDSISISRFHLAAAIHGSKQGGRELDQALARRCNRRCPKLSGHCRQDPRAGVHRVTIRAGGEAARSRTRPAGPRGLTTGRRRHPPDQRPALSK